MIYLARPRSVQAMQVTPHSSNLLDWMGRKDQTSMPDGVWWAQLEDGKKTVCLMVDGVPAFIGDYIEKVERGGFFAVHKKDWFEQRYVRSCKFSDDRDAS